MFHTKMAQNGDNLTSMNINEIALFLAIHQYVNAKLKNNLSEINHVTCYAIGVLYEYCQMLYRARPIRNFLAKSAIMDIMYKQKLKLLDKTTRNLQIKLPPLTI